MAIEAFKIKDLNVIMVLVFAKCSKKSYQYTPKIITSLRSLSVSVISCCFNRLGFCSRSHFYCNLYTVEQENFTI